MLTPIIEPDSNRPIYMQIRDYVVSEISNGRLEIHDKLPSVRSLSQYLKVSRTTVENAYNQLLAEGYILSKDRSGYEIAYGGEAHVLPTTENVNPILSDELTKQLNVYDLASEYVSPESFDYKLWKRHLNHVLNYDAKTLYAYGDSKGEVGLRSIIAEHFYRSRGVIASCDQVIVGGGVTPLMEMLVRLFHLYGIDDIGIENPGFIKAQSIFRASRMKVKPIEVNMDGIRMASIEQSCVRSLYISPSHHFPIGSVIPVAKRQAILTWIDKQDGFIIEDDYNYELRYEGRPIPSLQSMDRKERVIYLGSFSTVLAPAIRVSFMVLPKPLLNLYEEHEILFSQTSSKLEQLALASLIESGDFQRHIKRIRKIYANKQQCVLSAISRHNPSNLKVYYQKGGLQLLLELKDKSEEEVVKKCLESGILVHGLNEYRHQKSASNPPFIVINFRGIETARVEEAVIKLMANLA